MDPRLTPIVITGASMRTVQGLGRKSVFARLCEGADGVGTPRLLDLDRFGTRHAYEIDDGAANPCGRATAWLIDTIEDAVREAGIDLRTETVAVIIGTGLREQASMEHWAVTGEAMAADAWDFEAAVRRLLGDQVAVHTLVNACGASLAALALGEDLLKLGQADAVVVAGTDSIAVSMFGLLDRVSPRAPTRIEPFETSRTGVLMGEGAAALVLRRGPVAKPLALLAATAINCDAAHETAPDRANIAEAIRLALATAGMQAADIDLVMAHGTGSQLNDVAEAAALAEVFGTAADRTLVVGLKSQTGHTAGASGLIGLIAAIESLHSGQVPPTLHLKDPIDDARRFDMVSTAREGQALRHAQINAFGFGGVNAVAIISRAL